MKLESLLQKIDKKVPILIRFDYPIRVEETFYEKNEVYYSGRLGDMPYSFLKPIQNFKVQRVSLEEHEYDAEISIVI